MQHIHKSGRSCHGIHNSERQLTGKECTGTRLLSYFLAPSLPRSRPFTPMSIPNSITARVFDSVWDADDCSYLKDFLDTLPKSGLKHANEAWGHTHCGMSNTAMPMMTSKPSGPGIAAGPMDLAPATTFLSTVLSTTTITTYAQEVSSSLSLGPY